MVTPDRPSKAAIVRPPSKSRTLMSPEPVLAASVFTAVLMSVVAPAPPSTIPLPARNATWSPTMFGPSPVRLSLIAPEWSDSVPPTPAQSAVTITSPRFPSPLLLAFRMLSSTSPSPRSSISPSWDWTIEPSCMTTRPAVPASAAVPL